MKYYFEISHKFVLHKFVLTINNKKVAVLRCAEPLTLNICVICEIRVTYLLMNFLPFWITMPLKAASTF